MKKTFLSFLVVGGILLGFSNCQAKSENKNSGEKPAVSSVSEEGGSVKLTKAMFLEKVWDYEASPKEWKFKGDKPALIDFYADWCGPCKIAAPILEEIAKDYHGKVQVYKIDTQVERELAAVFGVSGIPAFLYIPMSGKPTMTSGIARTKEDTKKMFAQNIDKLLLANN
ncbi:thioredoxin domain-containing protein [Maribellus sp. YY47]|uniref:thioredoxin family protein n=1 Tax=Maribellus sp. YY47 TaxID=2929486 RepID=UPI002001C666|nr:thioredoxin domain-containing protein [Maribellus sp. YY47]